MIVDKISEFVLLESLVMIRARDNTFGGRISYIDGDVFEIALNENLTISLGESVGITIYAEGLIAFDTYPIGFYRKHLLCILPPPIQRRIFQRRKDVLLPVHDLTCTIEASDKESVIRTYDEAQLLCEIKNLSMSEILFSSIIPLDLNSKDTIFLHIGDDLRLEAIIKHIKLSGAKPLYLAELQEITKPQRQVLKSLIINQLAIHRNAQIESELVMVDQDNKSNEINSYVFNNYKSNKN
ncbi:hypothetical protein [Paenibacillus urinalis]|uniref:hypothetical protein n=1 Tax=Paenibacillus urinalis TaxID=521520 RepID=UPI00196120AD